MPVNRNWAIGADFKPSYAGSFENKKNLDFLIWQVSQGVAKDSLAPVFYSEHRSLIELLGAYHYYRTEVSLKRNLETFLEAIGGFYYDFYVLDYEKDRNILNENSDDDAREFMRRVKQETGKKILLYSNVSTFNEMLQREADWIKDEYLWISQWWEVNYYNRITNILPKLPNGVTTFTIWQWGGDYRHPHDGWVVPGYKWGREYGVEQDSIDLNAFKGSLTQMKQFFGMNVPPSGNVITIEELIQQIIKLFTKLLELLSKKE